MELYDKIRKPGSFFLIAGPCVIEEESLTRDIAFQLKEITSLLGIQLIFKASYRKANRSKLNSYTGLGDQKGLKILRSIREELEIPVLTDIHSAIETKIAAEYVDILQIPAFLCRQTDLLLAAGETGHIINIKKGQFLSPEMMQFAVQKVNSTDNTKVMLTERGSMFGYNDLVVDYRGIPIMQETGVPVILDITHSLQKPNQTSGITGGNPEYIATLAKAGIAAGVNGIFMETHPEPSKALSDGANMLPLSDVKNLLKVLIRIREAIE